MLYQMLKGDIPVGRYKNPSQLTPGLPAALDGPAMRCLEPKKEQRCPDAAALRQALANKVNA